ncbi:PHD finger protein 11-like protein [Auxenochlorella protothecoides]|uniref:PHD finger protein 11-like protein n=1 Tax=Auxenochlorella protothecoides TaxID=3075 RepID=A0A087SBW3_AUXPR|nr:PHD finger protein 11-like protein [Auxenochlorella protothecoides]KFM23217.1 PHD finger protein 11-like protein [Auxenochlorella protothecoides]
MEQEQRNTAQAREVLEEEACHQRKQAGEWEAAAKAQAALVSGLKADVEDQRRTQQRLQHDLEALEAERRVERRDRTALAVRLRAAEAAAGAAGDRLTALQGLLSQREVDLARCNAALAESQAARSALEAEERRLAGAIASLGARVDRECDGLRAEVAALKRAAEQRESLVTELTSTQPPVDRASMAMPLPECINIVCNNVKGVFWTSSQRLTCQCRDCAGLGEKLGVMPLQLTPTEFERHAGMAASKKWKYTLRVPMEGGEAALLGDWMEARGLAVKAHLRHPRCHMAPPLSSERGSGLLDAPSAAASRSGGREAGPASTRLTREAAVRRRAEAPETQPEPAQTVAPAPLQPTSAGPAAALADPVVRAASAPLAPGSTLAGAGAGSSYFRPVQGGSLPGPRPHPGSAFNPVGSRLGANPRDPRVLALYCPGTGLAPGEAGEGGPASPASSSGWGRPARADAKPEVAKRARTEASPLAVAVALGASTPSLAGAGGAQHGPLIAHARGDPRKRGRGRGRGGPSARSVLSPQPREATPGPAHIGPPPQGSGAIATAQPAGTRDPPRILKWELSPLGQLWLGVRLGDREYTGLLASAAPPPRVKPPTKPRSGVPPLAMPLGPRGPDPADIARYWEKHNQGAEAGTLDPAAIVELAGKAVLRGRGIRCRLCGEKGATLGCMTTCPVSLHLPCAAKGGGLLLVEPYRVACEKHVGARGGGAQDRARESEGTGTYSETTSQDTLEDGSGIRPETAAPYQAPRQEAASVRPVTGKKPSLGFKTPYANLSALDTLSIVALNH